jgi:hypothetical protein
MTRTKTFSTLFFLLTLSASALAQTPAAQTPTPTPRKAERPPKPKGEANPLAARRRAQAVALLTSLADESAGFRDETLRARAQARAADALWETDRELARTMFRRAWDAAVSADREALRKQDEDMKAQLARGGPAVSSSPPDLRREVLRLAARRDRALGEEMLTQLSKSAAEEETAKAAAGEDSQRMGLAREMLAEGNTERALQFAEPALTRAEMQTVGFLSSLREKDAATADRLYAALLARAEADPASDANTASVLASYVFTPFTFFTVTPRGGTGTSTMRGDNFMPPDVAPALRASVLRAAARILLRPQTPEEYARTTSGRTGTYVIIRRLLPFFEQYAPDLVAPLNARAALLAADVPEGTRRSEAEGSYAYRPQRDEGAPARAAVQEALDRAERTTGVEARDRIYAQAAVNASWQGDARADELFAKINDADLARRVRKFIDFAFVHAALDKKDAEGAVARARKGDLSPYERAWAYVRAAGIVGATDRARAVALLEEATEEARRIDNNDPARARALTAIATRYEKLDRPRAWEFISEAARAANSAPAFTGEDAKMTVEFRTKGSAWITDFNVEEFDLPGVLAALAEDDWDRAVQLAQSFTGEAARVTAVVALGRAALLKKGK